MLQQTSKFAVYQVPTVADKAIVKTQPFPKDVVFDPATDIELAPVDLNTLSDKSDIFQALYRNYSSLKTAYISLQERKGISADKSNPLHGSSSLIYGEIRDLESMEHVLAVLREHDFLPSQHECVFYDVGSGSGKVVIAAALLYPFKVCRGIEILSSLHNIGLIAQKHYRKFFAVPAVELFLGSILDRTCCDWTDGDVVFANSTCFHDDLFRDMASIAQHLKIGSVMITLSQSLPAWTGFELFAETRENMSW
jgi:SAM-dependent methyltransferase